MLAIQETHVGTNSKETHKEHTWYFSGEVRSREGYTAGVGFVIENRFLQYVEDVEPVNDRLCLLRLRHAAPITLIAIYIPQAMRPEEEKTDMYKLITKQMKKYTHKGPTYTLGDFNARVQTRLSPADEQSIGPHTFDHRNADPLGRSEEVICSRQLFIDFCTENQLKAMNTYFQKQDNQLATYREIGVTREAPIQRGTHEQIDYVVTHSRWKNSVRDIFSDAAANIDSDHYPICAKTKVKL